jgi:hypothetical protein
MDLTKVHQTQLGIEYLLTFEMHILVHVRFFKTLPKEGPKEVVEKRRTRKFVS